MLTSSHPTGKHEELELLAQPQSCYIIEITETWWASSCVLRTVMDGYRLFYKGRQGRRGGWVVLFVKENLGCVTAICGDHGGSFGCFWVKLRGVVFEGSLTVDICHWPPNQDDRVSEAIFRSLKQTSGQQNLVLMGEFNYPDICWKNHPAVDVSSSKFLKCVGNCFLIQMLDVITRSEALLDLLLKNG